MAEPTKTFRERVLEQVAITQANIQAMKSAPKSSGCLNHRGHHVTWKHPHSNQKHKDEMEVRVYGPEAKQNVKEYGWKMGRTTFYVDEEKEIMASVNAVIDGFRVNTTTVNDFYRRKKFSDINPFFRDESRQMSHEELLEKLKDDEENDAPAAKRLCTIELRDSFPITESSASTGNCSSDSATPSSSSSSPSSEQKGRYKDYQAKVFKFAGHEIKFDWVKKEGGRYENKLYARLEGPRAEDANPVSKYKILYSDNEIGLCNLVKSFVITKENLDVEKVNKLVKEYAESNEISRIIQSSSTF